MKPAGEVLFVEAAAQLSSTAQERLKAAGYLARSVSLAGDVNPAALGRPDVACIVLDPSGSEGNPDRLSEIIRRLVESRVHTLVWGSAERSCPAAGPQVEWLGPQVSVDEVTGRLTTLAHYEPIVRRLEAELRGVQRLGEQLNRYFGEIDQEMRLAGRLQRDLLPHDVNDTSPIVFSTVYRPASWVSGDIYDLFRIDEHHLGMFIADAMGHGVAAGLMTMFLKQGLVPRQRDGKTLRIVSPAEALGNLHESLCRHQLPSCQFVTAAYAIIDTRSLDLCVARAGHPFPLHIAGASGDVRELDPGGGLLGIPDVDPEFEEVRTVLAPGDKFMLYTDGIEDVIVAPRVSHAAPTCFTPTFHEWAAKPAVELSAAVDDHLDHREGSLHPPDDITLLTLEVVRNS